MKTAKKHKGGLLLLACYLVVLLAWVCRGGVLLWRDAARRDAGQVVETALVLEDFTTLNGIKPMELEPGGVYFATTDTDAQMIMEWPAGSRVNNLVIKAAPNRSAGEMVLYYTTKPGQGFSEQYKLWPQKTADGGWLFELGGRRLYSLRLDPDGIGGVLWKVDTLVLNQPKPAAGYFTPSVLQGVLLLLLPLLGFAVLREIMAFVEPIRVRRRFERRWKVKADEDESG